MPPKYDPSALWVVLSEQSEGDLFSVYPKLLADILLQEEAARQDGDTSEAEKLVLPSDKDYRLKQYFYLVSLQKTILDEEDGVPPPFKVEDPPEEWAPWSLVLPTKIPHAPPPVAVKHAPGPVWDVGQVVKAARLISKPPLPVEFVDEQDMRCVYSIIYDVFRYKTILDQAIEDVEFFTNFPEYAKHQHECWLFLMELARRRWGARPRTEIERANRLLGEAGWPYKDIEQEMWQQRVHFAAAIARIRIKNKAFTLADLLPAHLREERITACVNKSTVTGWVNTFKAKKVAQLVKQLHALGYSYSSSRQLCAGEYRFDRVCPRFITLRPPENFGIGQLQLVKDGIIVLQEREFCEGASTLCRALRAHSLRGVVAQTHASSPRSSAYLAAQLRELAAVLKAQAPPAPATPELGRLVVFGAGDKVASYVLALRELGIEASEAPAPNAPVCVLSDQVYCETPAVLNALDGVVAALATPPNSYSAVTDPIDLVCGRGGDLAMLEILTESEIDSNGKQRVQSILEEQKKTLRTLMSKPQIQLILYETHSALEAENQAQVTRAVAEANRLARERHAWLKKKHRQHSPQKHTADTAAVESAMSLDADLFNAELDNDDMDDISASNASPKRLSDSEQTTSRSQPQSEDISGKGAKSTLPSEDILNKTNKSRPPSEDISGNRRPQSEDISGKRRQGSDVGSRPGTHKARPIPELPQPDPDPVPRNPDQDNPNVFVPDCDLFEIGTLPNLGNGLDLNYILDRDGCYLGLIQRKDPTPRFLKASDAPSHSRKKEITRLDAKYMIRVAEERGLFGAAAPPPPVKQKKKPERALSESKRKKRKNSFELERVAAPTYASITRSARRGSEPTGSTPAYRVMCCERHTRRHAAAVAYSAQSCTCDAKHRPSHKHTHMTYASMTRSEPAGRTPAYRVMCCERHTRRHAAAVALSAQACTCNARHSRSAYRRALADPDGSASVSCRPAEPPCRRPFPLVVHDLRLQSNCSIPHSFALTS